MLDADIIAEVHEATPWINSFVIVETVKDEKESYEYVWIQSFLTRP